MVASILLILKHYNHKLMHKEAQILSEMGKKTFPEGEGSIRLSMVVSCHWKSTGGGLSCPPLKFKGQQKINPQA